MLLVKYNDELRSKQYNVISDKKNVIFTAISFVMHC